MFNTTPWCSKLFNYFNDFDIVFKFDLFIYQVEFEQVFIESLESTCNYIKMKMHWFRVQAETNIISKIR